MIASAPAVAIVNAIVELHGLIPVVIARTIVEAVVACSLGRCLHVWFLRVLVPCSRYAAKVDGHTCIVEVVLLREVHRLVIVLAQVLYSHRFPYRLVFPCHMVGYKVDNDLHSSLVSTVNKFLKLLHTVVHLLCQVGVYVVIVGNGVW